MIKTVAIVGAGQAAGRAAHCLREQGYDGRIVLIGNEAVLPYERPPLSKAFLAGSQDLAGMLVNPAAFYDEAKIDVVANRHVDALELAERRLMLDDGRHIGFDALLLATGSRARELPGFPIDRRVIFSLRNHADAVALRERLQPGQRVVMIGGGFIGLEVAASACKLGCAVTVLEAAPALLARVLGSEIGAAIEQMFRQAGVQVKNAVRPTSVEASASGMRIRLSDETILEADIVVVGVGAVPNTELAADAGLACEDGVLVDEHACSSVPGIYAAGDVTRHPSRFYAGRIRLETWDNAEKQAAAAVRAMLGTPQVYDEIPWMWTDLFERNIQILGLAIPCEQRVTRGVFGGGPFISLGLVGGRVVQAVMVDAGRERRPLTKLMQSGAIIPPEKLADETVPLRSLG